MKLTGEMAEEAEQSLENLRQGIDVDKKIITSAHDFEVKLASIEILINHLHLNYWDHDDRDFFLQIPDLITELWAEIQALEKGEMHILLEEEAAQKLGKKWVIKHRKKIGEEIKEETRVDKKIIQDLHQAFVDLKQHFAQAEHLFTADLNQGKVKKINAELGEKEKEFKHIIERLLQFIQAYEQIFREYLKELK